MEWHYSTSPNIKVSKGENSAGKITTNHFWDAQSNILVNLLHEPTVNSKTKTENLERL